MMTINERVKKIRKDRGLTQEKFGKVLSVQRAAISKIEHGDNGVTPQMATLICEKYGINEEWLKSGKGPMKKKEPEDILNKVIESYHLPKETKILVEVYGQLNQEHQNAICEYLDEIKEQLLNRSENPTGSSEPAAGQTDTHVKTDAEHLADLQKELDTRKKPETKSAGSGSTGA
jgi:transcriptional regulator with XRE-family HTH domain